MTDAQKKMLDSVGGDMSAYNNMVAFGNFLCEMIEKYGKDVIEDIDDTDDKRSTSDKGE